MLGRTFMSLLVIFIATLSFCLNIFNAFLSYQISAVRALSHPYHIQNRAPPKCQDLSDYFVLWAEADKNPADNQILNKMLIRKTSGEALQLKFS